MKTIALILVLFFVSCKKESITPLNAVNPDPPVTDYYYYRINGTSAIDTVILKLNRKVIDVTLNEFGKGLLKIEDKDTLTIHLSSTTPGISFDIWNAENKLPSETIKTFSATEIKKIDRVGYVNHYNTSSNNNSNKVRPDSIIVYSYLYYIKVVYTGIK